MSSLEMDRALPLVGIKMGRDWLAICDGGGYGMYLDLWPEQELLGHFEEFLREMARVPLPGRRTHAWQQ